MTSIPPVEERQVRSCTDCAFFNTDTIQGCPLMIKYSPEEVDKRNKKAESIPFDCEYNFTLDEITVILDQYSSTDQLRRLIDLRISDLDGQLREGEIKLSLYHVLKVELMWVLQILNEGQEKRE